ncbi:MAG: hypothetical protein M1835_001022 [Candelina submexicana]|nr:MAG: hypothetical protein M1835_001022 [Candelina submexicana]
MATTTGLPGLDLPVNYYPKGLLPNALRAAEFNFDIITLREITMMRFVEQITNKFLWNEKIFDETITNRWKVEALATEGMDISEQMVDYCIAELKLKAKVFEATGGISVIDGDVCKSDSLVSGDLRAALETACEPLVNIPDIQKDWHPGSDNKVLDLVHPSLFPLVYGRSKILRKSTVSINKCISRSGDGEVVPVPPKDETDNYIEKFRELDIPNAWSSKYQWLPCDVEFGLEGEDDVKLTSYINNLHPTDFRDLYQIIGRILARAIALWNLSLTGLRMTPDLKPRIQYDKVHYTYDESRRPVRGDEEKEEDFKDRVRDFNDDEKIYTQPEPGTFMKIPQLSEEGQSAWSNPATRTFEESTLVHPKNYAVNLQRDFRQSGLQVIVKLATIHLNPSSPTYDGGSWHVEGQLNEHICATAIYYYSSHNITTSKLSFRKRGDTDTRVSYDQYDYKWLEAIFGLRDENSEGGGSTGTQKLGDVETKQGRLITFPNIYQHRVDPFRLQDETKPGHRKILAFFLVDPNIRIISTANVPCQRRDWWGRELRENGALDRLPTELQEQVVDMVDDFPISMEEAKEMRLELMEGRKAFLEEHDKEFDGDENFFLCEH